MKRVLLGMLLVAFTSHGYGEQDVPQNPELDFVVVEMDKSDQDSNAAHALTALERASLQEWVKNQDEEQDTEESEVAAEEAPPAPIAADTIAIKEIQNGRLIIAENGVTYKIPTSLTRKIASWKTGDLIRVEPTSQKNWVHLTNVVTNERVLAKAT